jgi:hypothetical protein
MTTSAIGLRRPERMEVYAAVRHLVIVQHQSSRGRPCFQAEPNFNLDFTGFRQDWPADNVSSASNVRLRSPSRPCDGLFA